MSLCKECACHIYSRLTPQQQRGFQELGTCSTCKQFTAINPDISLGGYLPEPRQAINSKLRSISAEIRQLEPVVARYHALLVERLELKRRHAELERKLTKVKATVITTEDVTRRREQEMGSGSIEQLINKLSPEEAQKLADLLEAKVSS